MREKIEPGNAFVAIAKRSYGKPKYYTLIN